jgi:hypothetical protein
MRNRPEGPEPRPPQFKVGISGVDFSNGSSATGSFVFNVDTNTFSNIDITLTATGFAAETLDAIAPSSGNLFEYSVRLYAVRDGPWQAVRQSSSLNLMPHEELQTYAWFHGILTSIMETMHAFETTLHIGAAIAASAPPEKLSEHDLNELAARQWRLKAGS